MALINVLGEVPVELLPFVESHGAEVARVGQFSRVSSPVPGKG